MILAQHNQEIGKHFDSDVIFIKAPMQQGVDDAVRHEIEELKSLKKSKEKLTVILETTGGYVETVERIANTFRNHYTTVEFIVPNYAYSAGTILVLSGDEIYMDYYSVLGPIDPQVPMEDSEFYAPGMGYLAKFEELSAKINDPNNSPDTTRAELAYLIKRFDPTRLFIIEQSIEHAKQLLREWLPKYKFKTWVKRATSGTDVTDADRQTRAEEIATVLGDAKRWHSHGRGVGLKELESDDIKLKVINYGKDISLNRNISNYYGLIVDYMAKNRYGAALHSKRGIRRLT
jgi:hypothetical protein